MSFYTTLVESTAGERNALMATSLVRDALSGQLTRERYAAFLCQAYHHVRHTVPLLMAVGSRLDASREWLRSAVAEYIEEEIGHQEWVLNDIAACGYDRDLAAASQPNPATELMVAYAYHVIDRVNPVGFFGMVHVLEGTSIAVADQAAEAIMGSTGLPPEAFTYLRSHGALDIEHVDFFRGLMDKVDDDADRALILHCAGMFYRLYADVFRGVEADQVAALAA
ncbi:TenA family transcriptional regulator [Parahaliea mediterranea]|uniref:Iron-containing redox enzyme family protein n=1 Tax=Parahaliea mediterranea TaxID=651086 RepID=A0A939DHC0_9GAMM|nr:iron-containing redox enzyme family protein [Parahaliea mediterranea]MBN7798099.1 iron-containing redox enzyme family protein [Parahaliea mediterranea]